MITKKRCPFRRQDCTDKCALYQGETQNCSIYQISNELYVIAEVALKEAEQKQEDKA